jgi:hypothetical protein
MRIGLGILLLSGLSACAGGAGFSENSAFSYFDQKDLNVYYFSHNCAATLCNPR